MTIPTSKKKYLTMWRFMGSYKWGYQPPNSGYGYGYSYPTYNPTYNYP